MTTHLPVAPIEISGSLIDFSSIVEVGPIKRQENWHFFQVFTSHGTTHKCMARTFAELDAIRDSMTKTRWPFRRETP